MYVLVRVSAFACARTHRGCSSIIQSAVVVQRGGKVAYSFVAMRCIASFARGEKSRRTLNGHLNGLARWFIEPERKIGVASINRLGKIRAVLCRRVLALGARQLTSRCAVHFQFTTGIWIWIKRVGEYSIVLPLSSLIIGFTNSALILIKRNLVEE